MKCQSTKPLYPRRAYAVAVRDGSELFLVAIVRRSRRGDVYVHHPHTHFGPKWDGHSSYHCSGRHHHKAYKQPFLIKERQRPDANFLGTENVITTNMSFGHARAIGVLCDRAKFDDVFKIADADLRPTKPYHLSVDLSSGEPIPPFSQTSQVVWQQTVTEFFPQIIVTLFD
jgi:hypothetical protein